MNIFFLLFLFQIKHFICDYYLQSQAQIKTKGQYGNLVGLGHTLEHVIGTMIILMPFLFVEFPVGLMILALFDGLIHYHCDYIKTKFGSKNPSEPIFWHELGLDQLVHQLTYAVIIYGVFILIT
jgi:hypothetical protein